MARRPFFSGNYGSALGSYDTAARLVAQAGQTQGAAMAGLGGNIAGMIKEYGLNKKKNMELDGQIDGTIAGMSNEDVFDFDVEINNNPVMRKLVEKQSKGNTTQAEKAQLAGYLSSRSKQQDLRRLRQSQDVAREMNEQRLGLARKMEDSQVRLSESTAKAKEALNRLAQIEEETLPEKIRLALDGAKESLAGQILRNEGARENLAYRRDIRGAFPVKVVGGLQRRALEAGVRKDEAGAVIAEEGAEQAEFAGAVRDAGPTPETIARRGEIERTRKRARAEALEDRTDAMFWSRGTPEEQGNRARRFEELRLKAMGAQLTKAEIENAVLAAPPSLRAQMKPIQDEMLALLKTTITNRKKGDNTVADLISLSPEDIDKLEATSVERMYVERYKSLQDKLAELIDNAGNVPHWVPN